MDSKISLSNVDLNLKLYALTGLLTCDKSEKQLITIKQIAIQIFSIGGIVAAACKFQSYVVLIVLGVGLVGITAYQVVVVFNRYLVRSQSRVWRPIFDDILASNYQGAYRLIEEVSSNIQKSGKSTCEKHTFSPNLEVSNCRYSLPICLGYLYSMISLLKRVEDSKGSKLSLNKLGEEWSRYFVRCQNSLQEYDLEDTDWAPSSIQSHGSALLSSMIEEIRKINPSNMVGDDPARWGGGAWDGTGKNTLKYAALLKEHRWEDLSPSEQEILDNILKCKHLKEIYIYLKT